MNIALIGYGKMGQAIEACALRKGHRVVLAVDPVACGPGTFPMYRDIISADMREADAALEFSRPETAFANLSALARSGVPAVSGTTGWYQRLPELEAIVREAGSALLYSSNFSIGVNLFYRIAAEAASLIGRFPGYDVGGYEIHHNRKADSPSGTARTLAELVISRLDAKTRLVWDKLDRPPAPDEFHFASLRMGSEPGTHCLIFDSEADTIEITHRARNREGLAQGAVMAAEWLLRRGQGVFTMEDVLADS